MPSPLTVWIGWLLIGLDPRAQPGDVRLARLAADDGDDPAAARHFARALELDPVGMDVRLEVARWALDTDEELARVSLRILEEVVPTHLEEWEEVVELRAGLED